MHPIVTLRGVSFRLPNGRELFSDLNLSLDSGLTALVGPNGVGKTTLARLICGGLEVSQGSILRRASITFLSQREEPPPISVDEYLGFDYGWSVLRERQLAGIDRESKCTALSGGQWMRVRLARVLDDNYLVLDEPTNDLDRDAREALRAYLRARESGALLISHDRECLALCENVVELSNRGVAKFGGGWSSYAEASARERDNLGRALDLAKRDREAASAARTEKLVRQEKRNRRGAEAAARGGMPKILLGARKRRAQVSTGKVDLATYQRANEAVREAYEAFRELKVDPVMYADFHGREIPAQKLIAEARGFNIRYDRWLYARDLDFSWRGALRLALKGGNGSGKTTLLKAILGGHFQTRGELRCGTPATLYIDQRCASLDDKKTVLENVRAGGSGTESEIRNRLAKFLFAKESVFQLAGDLSGGERLRLALARGFLSVERPELLVLDEPTNNLDLVNIEFLERLARAFRGALIVISHDEVFLRNCGVDQALDLADRENRAGNGR